jgi:hypothetical protein
MQWSRSVESLLGPYAVGIWNFDEGSGTTVSDLSGYGNDGTLVNNPTWRCAEDDSDYTPSGQGCALEFDVADDYVEVANNDSLNFKANDFTISAWVKSTSTETGNNNGIVYKKTTGMPYDNGYRLNMPNGTFNLRIGDGEEYDELVTNSGYNNEKWHHVAGVVKRDDELRIYVDGISRANKSTTLTGDIDNTLNLGIGTLIAGGSKYHLFYGSINDVRIYDRALDSVQAKALYYVGLDNLYNKGLIDEQECKERILVKK